jgi:molybdate transport system substrate-binding protein
MSPSSDLPVIPAQRADDLCNLHLAERCDLALFMAGNQFMVMPELISAFQARYPDIRNIFYETLPPRIEMNQILAGGAIFQGRRLSVYPDVYASVNLESMKTLEANGHIRAGGYHTYLHNRLTLITPRGNPAGIRRVEDLGREQVRVSQPDPMGEDIALHIMEMYRDAGGNDLVRQIMEVKRAEGTTILTVVHHRETPLRIAKATVDVGPVWATEAAHARNAGLAFDIVEPGERLDQRNKINYYIGKTAHAAHEKEASCFIDFIRSPGAQKIYEKYGFVSPETSSHDNI